MWQIVSKQIFKTSYFKKCCRVWPLKSYSGSIEKQSIQLDDHSQPFYSTDANPPFLSENKKLDICVADYHARSVVVVIATGKLRFRYIGPPPTTGNLFKQWSFTTNSQNMILITDFDNNRIQILDQDGRFLCYIDSCCL